MIRLLSGNLLHDQADALVNTVNCVGVMGKGIALAFKQLYPANFNEYASACARKEVLVGKMFITSPGDIFGPRWIINFPTKQHWRDPSQMKWIEDGLSDLVAFVKREHVRSIALPALGCANGGLAWEAVRPRIETAFEGVDTEVRLYKPQ